MANNNNNGLFSMKSCNVYLSLERNNITSERQFDSSRKRKQRQPSPNAEISSKVEDGFCFVDLNTTWLNATATTYVMPAAYPVEMPKPTLVLNQIITAATRICEQELKDIGFVVQYVCSIPSQKREVNF